MQRTNSTLVCHLDNAFDTLARVGVWLGSLLLSVALFSLSLSLFPCWRGGAPLIFYVTLIFALPVWCLYLPIVVALKNAEDWRMWIILVSGILIGPASVAVRGLMLLQWGGDPQEIWHGDPLLGGAGGVGVGMISALIVGFLAASSYGIALKVLHHRREPRLPMRIR